MLIICLDRIDPESLCLGLSAQDFTATDAGVTTAPELRFAKFIVDNTMQHDLLEQILSPAGLNKAGHFIPVLPTKKTP